MATEAPEAPVTPKTPATRKYGIISRQKLDLSASPEEIVAELTKHLNKNDDGSISASEVEVLVKVGSAVAADPRSAVKALAEIKLNAGQELVGDFESVADTSFNEVPNVRAALKPVVEMG